MGTASSSRSCSAAIAYASRGARGAWERMSEKRGFEGDICFLTDMPYLTIARTAADMISKVGQYCAHEISYTVCRSTFSTGAASGTDRMMSMSVDWSQTSAFRIAFALAFSALVAFLEMRGIRARRSLKPLFEAAIS